MVDKLLPCSPNLLILFPNCIDIPNRLNLYKDLLHGGCLKSVGLVPACSFSITIFLLLIFCWYALSFICGVLFPEPYKFSV